MTHRRAVALMILATLLWSIAGVVTRQLDSERSFEITFWRSLFNALALTTVLTIMRGPSFWKEITRASWPSWVSGLCWSVMFTAFMVAITLTTVSNVLVSLAVGPLITALFARLFLGHILPTHTWAAITVAGCGIAWMFGREAVTGGSLTGSFVALMVPLAAAVNWTVLQFVAHGNRKQEGKARADMLPAVLIGAVISALATLPLAYPFQASAHDLGLLAILGSVQLAIPCLLVVRISRELPAAEIALLGLLEVVFGVTWAWLGAGEQPSMDTLVGGVLILGALIFNEVFALNKRKTSARNLSQARSK